MTLLEALATDTYLSPDLDLSHLADTYLFYPCSGSDILTPLTMFANYIKGFCFADYGYFKPRHQNTRRYGLDKAVAEAEPIEAPSGEWICERRVAIEGERDEWMRPSDSLLEHYRLAGSGKTFEVLRSGTDARTAFANLTEPLGIFFYRGDSLGEGGSGILWNSQQMHDKIASRLVEGGLLITDGSNPGTRPYDYSISRGVTEARDIRREDSWRWRLNDTTLFGDYGLLKCVGYAGHRYGATLVWTFTKDRRRVEAEL